MSARSRVRLHIDTLAVHGLNGLSRAALAAAVQQELHARLRAVANEAGRWAAGHRDVIDAGTIRIPAAPRTLPVGQQIAAAVARGVFPR